jgi:hypothetical protein
MTIRGIFGIIALLGVIFIIIGILFIEYPLGITLLVIGVIICGIGIGGAIGKDCRCCRCCAEFP